ncbi:TetR/AcrR family transcriptional regulator [Humibacter ginsenosidimutans]|uniref:TetR/AcrR family transcriptional regulator n=1 Tax=Humibacter ginsenosidimutans TaxID=2599293 RepID=A0A5B8M7V5_9MICO|nr:TetR/AcrR family transcriptional regulator [Humibacter ginsenosidimutans]QDZ16486.1 TetR/AcrR family transcriptional regulator [Humibacter ginsenosidimutans]
MKLTAKGEATRARILDATAGYLRSETAGAVTLDDVLAASHTSKGQLFHYFPGGKAELLLAVARLEAERVLDDQRPYLDELDSWDSWSNWRTALLARYRAQGAQCPLASLMDQVGSVDGAAEVATALLENWQAHVRRGIRRMQEGGAVSQALDADRTAAAFIAGIQGGVTVLRTTGSTDHLEVMLDFLLAHLRDTSSSRAA